MYSYPDYLMHYGVKGMKWGVRRAEKKRSKWVSKANDKIKISKSNAKHNSNLSKKYKNMSDKDYSKMFDDKEFLRISGGPHSLRINEVKQYEQRSLRDRQTAKMWENILQEFENTPISELRYDKDYNAIVNRYINNSSK